MTVNSASHNNQVIVPVNATNANRDFLPAALEVLETPPSRTAHIVSMVIMAIFLIALGWAYWGKIDVVMVAQGRIAPASHVKEVNVSRIATVRSIHVVEGQPVVAGDLLLELDDTVQRAELTAAEIGVHATSLEIRRLEAELELLDGHVNSGEWPDAIDDVFSALQQQRLYANIESFRGRQEVLDLTHAQAYQELLAMHARREGKQAELNYANERLERGETIAERGFLSLDELWQLRTAVEILRQDIREVEMTIEAQRLSVQRHDIERRNIIRQTREALISALESQYQQLSQLERDVLRFSSEVAATRLTAPVDGIIESLSTHTIGGSVTPQVALMQIVPTADRLEIEALIRNQDIGYVEPGQQVTIKIDSFPFTTHGTLEGAVSRVSQDAIATDTGYMFTARIRLSEQSVATNPLPLRPGMTVVAEIRTADRRILSFFMDPIIKHFSESLGER